MQCFSNACKLKGVHFMTKIGKRIIIIAIPVAVSAVLLLSSVFSAAKFNTFNCFSSFPARRRGTDPGILQHRPRHRHLHQHLLGPPRELRAHPRGISRALLSGPARRAQRELQGPLCADGAGSGTRIPQLRRKFSKKQGLPARQILFFCAPGTNACGRKRQNREKQENT